MARRMRGFTLIELLVVVAIVGLLISLLLPSLQRARRSARNVQCMSNMRQIIAGVLGYQFDNRDAMPMTMETVSAGMPVTVSWWAIENYQKAVEPYLQMDRGGVERDGRSRGKGNVWFDPGDPDARIPVMWGSFEDNGLITGVPRRLTQIRRPAETVYATLREKQWSEVVGVEIPEPPPVENPDHPFWVSEFFDMCLDPWAETADPADPYYWGNGLAMPPCALFPDHPACSNWDEQIDGRFSGFPDNATRYGEGIQPYAFCDGHVANLRFEQTYVDPVLNFWDIE